MVLLLVSIDAADSPVTTAVLALTGMVSIRANFNEQYRVHTHGLCL